MNQFIPLELLTVHRERKYLSSDVPSTSAGSDILQFGWLVWWWRGQVSVAFAGRRHEVHKSRVVGQSSPDLSSNVSSSLHAGKQSTCSHRMYDISPTDR